MNNKGRGLLLTHIKKKKKKKRGVAPRSCVSTASESLAQGEL